MKAKKSKMKLSDVFFLIFGVILILVGWSVVKSNADGAYLKTTALSWGWGFMIGIVGALVLGKWIAENSRRK